jgi:hypothetical protein
MARTTQYSMVGICLLESMMSFRMILFFAWLCSVLDGKQRCNVVVVVKTLQLPDEASHPRAGS